MTTNRKPEGKLPLPVERRTFKTDMQENWPFLLMMVIPTAFFILFCYWPMYGVLMAFQDYKVGAPFLSGSGLGLAIVYSMVERNGGTITARSTPQKGSVFTVTFPVCDAKEVPQ